MHTHTAETTLFIISNIYNIRLRSEIYTMKYLDHPNIAKVYEGFERRQHVYLIMEYCSGGDLNTRLPYTEAHAANIVRQILSAVAYLHDKKVVHRDLKMENVCFENNSSNARVKLIDFGLATKYLSNDYKLMRDRVGTLYSMAPQVLQGVYNKSCDLWSVGVVTYMLLSGGLAPFRHPTRKGMIHKIMNCKYNYDDPVWQNITPEARDFIDSLLRMDPNRRMPTKRALHHKWLQHQVANSFQTVDATSCHCHGLTNFSKQSKLKRLALLLLAHWVTTEEITEIRHLFDKYDRTGDGRISYKEFVQSLQSCQSDLDMHAIHQLFQDLSLHKDGYINYSEFVAATLEARGHVEPQRVKDVFDRFDCDQSGSITKQNLIDIISRGGLENLSESFVDEIFVELGSDAVTYEEFCGLFDKTTTTQSLAHQRQESEYLSEELVDENAIIPGGRYTLEDFQRNNGEEHIPPTQLQPPAFVYDPKSNAMHRIENLLVAS